MVAAPVWQIIHLTGGDLRHGGGIDKQLLLVMAAMHLSCEAGVAERAQF
jgi:hypothetical protein